MESGLTEFSVAYVRSKGSDVQHFPLAKARGDDVDNYSHCQFVTPLSGAQADEFANDVEVKIAPTFK